MDRVSFVRCTNESPCIACMETDFEGILISKICTKIGQECEFAQTAVLEYRVLDVVKAGTPRYENIMNEGVL